MLTFYAAADYQPQCQQRYESYKQQLLACLPQAQIEHIGSSAIENALSKGDLDIYVAVDASAFEHAISQICCIGFIEKSNTLRTHELCMLESLQQDDVAIQLVVKQSKWQIFLIFRDRLTENKNLVTAYNQLKQESQYLTMDEYRLKKSKFIDSVLSAA